MSLQTTLWVIYAQVNNAAAVTETKPVHALRGGSKATQRVWNVERINSTAVQDGC